jgi:ADP-dependent phosphofructokinase/glucokinase
MKRYISYSQLLQLIKDKKQPKKIRMTIDIAFRWDDDLQRYVNEEYGFLSTVNSVFMNDFELACKCEIVIDEEVEE